MRIIRDPRVSFYLRIMSTSLEEMWAWHQKHKKQKQKLKSGTTLNLCVCVCVHVKHTQKKLATYGLGEKILETICQITQ